MFQMLRLFVVTLLLASLPLNAQDYVPDELQGWQQWVLKDKAYRNCPFLFDRTSAARSHFLAGGGRLFDHFRHALDGRGDLAGA